MNVISRTWPLATRSDSIFIYPLGDIHIGAAACDEKELARVVAHIAETPNAYWIGMGDYIDAINRSDPRFDPGSLAPWFTVPMLSDIVSAQLDRWSSLTNSIAPKCLAMLCGNHETAITKHYERDVFHELVTRTKQAAKLPEDHRLSLGYYGWLRLTFRRSDNGAVTTIRIFAHHGFGGGKLAGGKALNMERMLWTRNAHLVLMGHTHNRGIVPASIDDIAGETPVVVERYGIHTGTFLRSTVPGGPNTYSGVKGFFPLGIGCTEIRLTPGDAVHARRIKPSLF